MPRRQFRVSSVHNCWEPAQSWPAKVMSLHLSIMMPQFWREETWVWREETEDLLIPVSLQDNSYSTGIVVSWRKFWIRKPLYSDAASSCCGHAVALSVFPTLVSRPIWRQFYSAGGGGGVVNQSEHFSPVSLCTLPTVVNQSGLIWRWCAPPREPICTNLAMRARLFCFFRFKMREKDITTHSTPRF